MGIFHIKTCIESCFFLLLDTVSAGLYILGNRFEPCCKLTKTGKFWIITGITESSCCTCALGTGRPSFIEYTSTLSACGSRSCLSHSFVRRRVAIRPDSKNFRDAKIAGRFCFSVPEATDRIRLRKEPADAGNGACPESTDLISYCYGHQIFRALCRGEKTARYSGFDRGPLVGSGFV